MLFCSEWNVLRTSGRDAGTQCLSRTHSVFRAYGEDYAGRRLEISLSCSEGEIPWKQANDFERKELPSYGRIGRFSVDRNANAWKHNPPFSVRPDNGLKGTALPGGKTVRKRCPDVLNSCSLRLDCGAGVPKGPPERQAPLRGSRSFSS